MRRIFRASTAAVLLLAWAAPGWAQYTHRRAGCPLCVAPWAKPSDTGHYIVYPVGGGKPLVGEAPYRDEGTWGWDYCGLLFPKKVFLRWSHGKCYQGGTGAYRTDGPRLPRDGKKP